VTVRRARILLIAPSLDIVGGQSIQASRLLDILQHEPDIQIDFLPINPRIRGPLRFLQRVKYLRTLLTTGIFLCMLLARARKYDVLHSFSASNYSFLLSAALVLLVGRLYGKKTIVNYHDGRASQHLAQWRSSGLLRLADRIVTPSEYLVDIFAQFGYRAQSIYNVIDLNSFRYREREPIRPVFLHNRGLEDLYNVPCTLKAFELVQQSYPEARLTVAHDGPLRAELERMVNGLGLRYVHFTGTVPHNEVAALYDAADIYLTSPNIDNMPLSLLECYASGLPVVATKAGGIPYIARDEETALLVELNDHEAMARAALRLIEEDGLAQRLALAARVECARYSPAAVRKEWLALYKGLLPSNSPWRK
jgi:glycosyltransferase involved in cell wall biosynthesis